MNFYLMFNWFRYRLGEYMFGNLLMYVMDVMVKFEMLWIY